ncbi:beta-ketoacyl synthase chain length factor [Shewanella dokdonensis]|uniref:Beta-ketoacyl synthase chain length factor n=1 Tax=Shewanella dokdonensis TaxID=712036 RepID=A0ABX8DAI6_9GAMM|nr:beta-ketoacyl synthase chain length factor [Shewanella dokdonensis]MCL1075751.1 beta-ketoacyl synthase chain length factor [Shewanella dokdonensis]QVK21899.1 beta-ketoacyl synthase chain length factor [Shewanella dokdonensis]
MQLAFSILSWGAWSPDYQQQQDWQHWQHADKVAPVSAAAPSLTQIPSMQKRRFSRLTKMMLEAAFQAAAPQHCRSVFASRHGELHRTVVLLEDILSKQPLSPTGFSQSVHNTASGVFGIVTQNQAASTSIAAGSHTLAQALLESWGQLAEDPSPILLVFGDDPVPPVYDKFTDEPEYPLALALVLAPAPHPGIATLTLTPQKVETRQLCYGELLQSLATGDCLDGALAGMQWQLLAGSRSC